MTPFRPGDRGRTAGGMPYRVLCTDAGGKLGPVVALITIGEAEQLGRFTPEGKHEWLPRQYDLVPPVRA